MEQNELIANHREVKKGAAKWLRKEGLVPGMLYGHGVGNVPVQFERRDLKRVLAETGGSQLIYLRLDESADTQPALPREIQRDVFTGDPIHIDFLAVSMTEKITAEVTIVLTGRPEPVAAGEGILLQGANSIEIECLPANLIPVIEVDVSHLDFDHSMYISDLVVPDEITVLSDPEEMVAQVAHEQMEAAIEEVEEEELLVVEEMPEVEVIGRGRDEDEEEEFSEEE
jgi:large subunit ribosomal protein L25